MAPDASDAARIAVIDVRPGRRGRRPLPRPDPHRHDQRRRRQRTGGAQGRRARRGAAGRRRHRGRGPRVRARPHQPARPLGRYAGQRPAPLLLHGHLDVVPADAADWQVDPFSGEIQDGCVWGRGAVDMKDFDAILLSVVRARARAGQAPRAPDGAGVHRRRGGRRPQGRRVPHRAPRRHARRLHRGDRRGRRLQRHRARPADLPRPGRREGDGLDAADRARHRRARVDAQPRQPRDPARGRRRPGRRARVAGPADPAMEVLLAAVAELAGTEATPENAEALVEEFGPPPACSARCIRNSANPTRLDAGYKVNVVPGAAPRADRRAVPARLRGRVLRDDGRAAGRGHRGGLPQQPGRRSRRPTRATWSAR